jgi:hypothetical protein
MHEIDQRFGMLIPYNNTIMMVWCGVWLHMIMTVIYRVGVNAIANIPNGSDANFCNIGNANAAVLPEPVLARPITSLPIATRTTMRYRQRMEDIVNLPASTAGIHCC